MYAIGDNCYFEPEEESPDAGAGKIAISRASAAHNVLADINGKPKKEMKLNLHGFMVSIGSRYAVAKVSGLPQLSGYLATALKHIVNMHYLFGIGGFTILAEYINHQLLHNTRESTYFGPHFTAKSTNLWLVPLRIYLGYMWVMSGLEKYHSGWFDYQMLASAITPPAVRP